MILGHDTGFLKRYEYVVRGRIVLVSFIYS